MKRVLFFILSLVTLVAILLSGCTPTPAETPVSAPPTTAPAAEQPTAAPVEEQPVFDWKKYAGTEITYSYDEHAYSEAIQNHLAEFEELTGIKVKAELLPDSAYWDKLNIVLSSKSGEWDVVGTGIEPMWDQAKPGYLEPLEKYLNDPTLTSPDYDFQDILPFLREASMWDLNDCSKIGSGSTWIIPHSFENMNLMYRKDIFEKHQLAVPTTVPELLEVAKQLKTLEPDMIPFTARGTRFWSAIHPGYISMAASYGVKDFDENCKPVMNSPQSAEFMGLYADLIRNYGPKNWSSNNWYEVVDDLANSRAVMAVDANMFGFWNDVEGASKAAGNIAFAPPPKAPGAANFNTNIWIWALALNSASKNKEAAWYFIQWATGKDLVLKGALDGKMINPIRQSVWDDPKWKAYATQPTFNNYYDTFYSTIPFTSLLFTPRAGFGAAINEWAATLQDVVTGNKDPQEELDALVKRISQ